MFTEPKDKDAGSSIVTTGRCRAMAVILLAVSSLSASIYQVQTSHVMENAKISADKLWITEAVVRGNSLEGGTVLSLPENLASAGGIASTDTIKMDAATVITHAPLQDASFERNNSFFLTEATLGTSASSDPITNSAIDLPPPNETQPLNVTEASAGFITVNQTQSWNPMCNVSLHQAAVDLALQYTPPGSRSFEKNQRLLQHIRHFHHGSLGGIFEATDKNIVSLIKGFGVRQIEAGSLTSRMNTTALVYYSIGFKTTCRQKGVESCRNMADQPRIIIQTEQLPNAGPIKGHLKDCHKLPLCVIWDWSEYNWAFANQTLGVAESMVILPTMFQGRFDPFYSWMNQVPLADRPVEIAFFGKATGRRSNLYDRFVQEYKRTTQGKLPVTRFGRLKIPKSLARTYIDAKVCPIIHAYSNRAAGEFHRLGDFLPSGCIPIMESIPEDVAWTRILSECGGVIFANIAELPGVVVEQLMRLRGPSSSGAIYQRQAAAKLWWDEGINWGLLLKQIFIGGDDLVEIDPATN